MHAGIERRAPETSRIPLDLWVRLSHEDYAEPFDADGVDLSSGGLALRSDYLPEVGDRLSCRFDLPTGTGELALDGEVVWAHEAGERSGEFGLRFDSLAADDSERLRSLVEHLAPDAVAGTRRARLHLDGVATPIDADISTQSDAWLTAEQALPFLRLGMGVAVEGAGGPPQGRLASVDLRIENGVPRLVLGVELDTEEAAAAPSLDTLDEAPVPGADATLQDFDFVAPSALDGADRTGADQAEDGAFADAAEAYDEAYDDDDEAYDEAYEDATDGGAVRAPIEARREAARVFQVEADEDASRDDASLDDHSRDALAPGEHEASDEVSFVTRARAAMAPRLAKLRAGAVALAKKMGPAAKAVWAKLALAWAFLLSKGGPSLKAFGAKVATLGGKVLKRGKRRTTAAAPRRVAQSPRRRQRGSEEEEAAPSKKIGRKVLAACVVAFCGVGAIVYGFSGDDAEPVDASEPAEITALPEANAAPVAAPSAMPAAPEAPSVAAAAPSEAEEPEGGRLGEPTFPTLAEAQQRRDEPVEEGASFGADSVENGRTTSLQMSQPISTLRGQRQEGGFTVTIPGALSLDPAGPMAAANPSIERAIVLNRGDHCVLTVRFVAGRTPDYRVVAQGRSIEVTIGR